MMALPEHDELTELEIDLHKFHFQWHMINRCVVYPTSKEGIFCPKICLQIWGQKIPELQKATEIRQGI